MMVNQNGNFDNGDRYVISSLSESDLSNKVHQDYRKKIQGIEKVYVPYYEFHTLATFPAGKPPQKKVFHCDAILQTITPLPDDFSQPRLVSRSSGTLFPVAYEPAYVRNTLRRHVIEKLPVDYSCEDGAFNLTIEYNGRYFFPFWVAYFQGARQDLFEIVVFDPLTGDASEIGKDIVEKGFILQEEARVDLPPWF